MHEKSESPVQGDRYYWSVYGFRFFNAGVAQIILGAPLVVYAKALGANSLTLGILASFAPLMAIVQPWAATLVPRLGYQNLTFISEVFVTLSMLLVAVMTFAFSGDHFTKLVLLGLCLCFFNVFRYASFAGFTPWMTALVPMEKLGVFVSWVQLFKHFGCLCALWLCGWMIAGHVNDWGFARIFMVAVIGGVLTCVFIKRIPDVKALDVIQRSSQVISKRAMLAYPHFLYLVILNLVIMSITGSLEVFAVEYLREIPLFAANVILYLVGLAFLAALLTLPLAGRLVDRFGSKPIMNFSILLYCIVLIVWFLIASDVLPVEVWLIGVLTFFTGLAQANYMMANRRLLMATMPEAGRNHYMAFFSLLMAFGLSATLVAWGVLLDLFVYIEATIGIFHLRRHSYYFLGLLLLAIGSWISMRWVKEAEVR